MEGLTLYPDEVYAVVRGLLEIISVLGYPTNIEESTISTLYSLDNRLKNILEKEYEEDA